MTFLTLGFPTISKDSINQGYEFQHFGATDDFVEPKIYQKTPTKNRLNLGVSKKKKNIVQSTVWGCVFFCFFFWDSLKNRSKPLKSLKCPTSFCCFPIGESSKSFNSSTDDLRLGDCSNQKWDFGDQVQVTLW